MNPELLAAAAQHRSLAVKWGVVGVAYGVAADADEAALQEIGKRASAGLLLGISRFAFYRAIDRAMENIDPSELDEPLRSLVQAVRNASSEDQKRAAEKALHLYCEANYLGPREERVKKLRDLLGDDKPTGPEGQ